MTAHHIDGKALSQHVQDEIGKATALLKEAYGKTPTLTVVLVGEDPASQVYVRSKIKATEACGLHSLEHRLPASASEEMVKGLVRDLSQSDDVDGILVQLPLPDHISSHAVINAIAPEKDVDGLTEISAGRLALGKPGLHPCTPTGCVMLAKQALGELTGKHVVIIGRSILVGRPAAQLFLAENCTVTIAHSKTDDLPAVCRQADILVPAVGRPQFVQGDWIKPGATVIDVGINRIDAPEKGAGKTRLVGDVDFDSAQAVAGHITPVPGGVGPMTIACLMRNTLLAACARRGWQIPDPQNEPA